LRRPPTVQTEKKGLNEEVCEGGRPHQTPWNEKKRLEHSQENEGFSRRIFGKQRRRGNQPVNTFGKIIIAPQSYKGGTWALLSRRQGTVVQNPAKQTRRAVARAGLRRKRCGPPKKEKGRGRLDGKFSSATKRPSNPKRKPTVKPSGWSDDNFSNPNKQEVKPEKRNI